MSLRSETIRCANCKNVIIKQPNEIKVVCPYCKKVLVKSQMDEIVSFFGKLKK